VELPAGSGKFVDIESGGPHECILNVGDCLHQWTGLHSARHRVHVPEQPQGKGSDEAEDIVDERFSIAYFAKPDRAASLRPLLDGVGPGDDIGSGYMTAGEFQHMRIQGTYA
jgi:isopenicillin N synthase-like dioxygenase